MVDVVGRGLMCACRPCYLLFTAEGAALRYRAVPDRYLSFAGVVLDARQWDELEIPVGLAFFFPNSQLGRTVAFYPGPAKNKGVVLSHVTQGSPAERAGLKKDGTILEINGNPVEVTTEVDVDFTIPTASAKR